MASVPAETLHQATCASLSMVFAHIVKTDELIQSITTADHDKGGLSSERLRSQPLEAALPGRRSVADTATLLTSSASE